MSGGPDKKRRSGVILRIELSIYFYYAKLPFSENVTLRCLRQRAVLPTIMVTTERKEAVPDAQRKYQNYQKIKRTFTARACCQAERGAANSL